MKTIPEVMEILEVKSRKTIYGWMDRANVETRKVKGEGNTTYLTDEDIEEIKKVKEWVAKGNKLDTYVPTEIFVDLTSEMTALPSPPEYQQLELFANIIESVATTVYSKINNSLKSPIQHWKELLYAHENDLLLTTDEITAIIGIKPVGGEFRRGTFVFIKDGKIGRQTAWRIEKANYPPK